MDEMGRLEDGVRAVDGGDAVCKGGYSGSKCFAENIRGVDTKPVEAIEDVSDSGAGGGCHRAKKVDGDLVEFEEDKVTTVVCRGSNGDGRVPKVSSGGPKDRGGCVCERINVSGNGGT